MFEFSLQFLNWQRRERGFLAGSRAGLEVFWVERKTKGEREEERERTRTVRQPPLASLRTLLPLLIRRAQEEDLQWLQVNLDRVLENWACRLCN
ncbi:hypothetical protein PRUPE_8G075400 [Prunus persica]|uniref:Uncharacterized protein n=1 Tax=Prunus persica TaxID=3760 RepID=A0A251MUP7_PRUPE|nr:hypothetical protein PRUPE_8G075400 [Prunus persica]